MRISDWSSDVCSSDLAGELAAAADGADDAGGDRVVEAERRTDRDHPLARPELVRIAQAQRRQSFCVDLEQGEIGRAAWRESVCRTGRSRWRPYHYNKKVYKTRKKEKRN